MCPMDHSAGRLFNVRISFFFFLRANQSTFGLVLLHGAAALLETDLEK